MVQKKRVRGALGVAALSVIVGCNESTPAPEANKPAEAAHTAALENGQNVVAKDSAGIATFITGNLAAAPQIPAEGAASLSRDALAPVVEALAPQFHLAVADLVFKKGYTDAQGDSHFRYAIVRNDIPVFGGEFRLHVRDGQVIAANTNVRSDLKADAKPAIAADAAVSSAASDKDALEGFVTDPRAELVYFRDGDELRLMYKVEQTGVKADGTPVRDTLLVDAKSGDVQLRIPQIKEALNRRMYDAKHTTSTPGTLVRTEGQAEVADPVVNTNYNHLGTVYNCYHSLFGRDSINNAGATLISTVHYSNNYVNAYWDGTQMVYGDGDGVNASNLANSLDVTAHELTHAVTDNESDLIYSGESGGLNESMSDIFGAICEWYGDGQGPISPRYWIVGDDIWTPSIPNDGLRYMNNPTLDGDSIDYYPDYYSGLDVHYSSGLSNLAFYLLSEGGTHPRAKTTTVVAGIGIEKAARIFYKANADLLLPSSNFEAAKTATEQAATQLGYDAATIASVSNAWKAVGVGVPIPPPPTDPLEKDVPITGISGTSGSQKFYKVTIPEGAYDLTFTLSGGTGDADLYVRYNNAPTTSSYDCRPYRSGNEETCTFAAPQHGTWYVMLRGFSSYTNTSLKVTWKGGYIPVQSGVPYKYFSGAAGSSTVFTITVPERKPGSGKNSLYVQTGEGYGNPDVYVKLGSAPTKSDYDCRSVKEHMSETCNLLNVPAGKYYIEVFGAKGGYEDIAFIASHL